METARRPRIPRNVLVLGFVALTSGFGQDLITPVLPGFLALIGGFGLGKIWDTVSASAAFFISAGGSALAAILFLVLRLKHKNSR